MLAKQGLISPCSDLFGVAGMAWLGRAPLDVVYRRRVLSLLECAFLFCRAARNLDALDAAGATATAAVRAALPG